MYSRNQYIPYKSSKPGLAQDHDTSSLQRLQAGPVRSTPASSSYPPSPPPSSTPRSSTESFQISHKEESGCRLSALIKTSVIVCVLLATIIGLAIFLTNRGPSTEGKEGGSKESVEKHQLAASLSDILLNTDSISGENENSKVIKNGKYILEEIIEMLEAKKSQ